MNGSSYLGDKSFWNISSLFDYLLYGEVKTARVINYKWMNIYIWYELCRIALYIRLPPNIYVTSIFRYVWNCDLIKGNEHTYILRVLGRYLYCNRADLLDEENTLLRRTKMQITCKCIRPPVCDTKRTDYYDLLYVFAHFVYGNYREHVELRNGTNYICTLWIHIC